MPLPVNFLGIVDLTEEPADITDGLAKYELGSKNV